MSLFDRFVSVLRSSVPGVHSRDQEGPLNLKPGDRVVHYGEDFTVRGTRILESDSGDIFLYCMSDEVGRRAILSAVDGETPEFSLQRIVEHQVRWESDVVEDFEGETYNFAAEGRARLLLIGDTGMRSCRSVAFRLYGDAAGDQMLVLEDYGGQRETRLAEPLFEGEIEIHRARRGETTRPTIATIEPEPPSGTQEVELPVTKGSPLAAARMLGRDQVEPASQEISQSEDEWSDAYDDDSWADDDFGDGAPARKPNPWKKARAKRVALAATVAPSLKEAAAAEDAARSVFDTSIDEDAGWPGF